MSDVNRVMFDAAVIRAEEAGEHTTNEEWAIQYAAAEIESEWCDELCIDVSTVWHRLNRGWAEEEALLTPVSRHNNRNYGRHQYNGETLSLREIAKRTGIGYSTLWKRLKRGATLEQAINRSTVPSRCGCQDA